MDGLDPDTWRWIWLIAAIVFGIGEIAVAGTFFLAPFAIGAAAAAVLSFASVGVPATWVVFLVVSGACFLPLRRLSKSLDDSSPTLGVGSYRQLGQQARVIEQIDHRTDSGFVMLGPDRWRAESLDGSVIEVGATVHVEEVKGTRVIVSFVDPAAVKPANPPSFDPRPPEAEGT